MAPIFGVSHLSNPLATPKQLANSASQLDGVPIDLEDSIRYESIRLIQAAGILLRLPQELIAETIVIFSRFWLGPEGGSLLVYAAKGVVAASIYLVTKPSAHPIGLRRLLSVVNYVSTYRPGKSTAPNGHSPEECFLSEGTYQSTKLKLVKIEAQILRVLGYQTHVALPYSICINYLQSLDVVTNSSGHDLARRAFAHLNSALLSPQLPYLTHQPCSIATAAIYLAAKEVKVKLPGEEWWEVFDVDREELGFLVVSLTSMTGFANEEAQTWSQRLVPLIVDDVKAEIETRRLMDNGE